MVTSGLWLNVCREVDSLFLDYFLVGAPLIVFKVVDEYLVGAFAILESSEDIHALALAAGCVTISWLAIVLVFTVIFQSLPNFCSQVKFVQMSSVSSFVANVGPTKNIDGVIVNNWGVVSQRPWIILGHFAIAAKIITVCIPIHWFNCILVISEIRFLRLQSLLCLQRWRIRYELPPKIALFGVKNGRPSPEPLNTFSWGVKRSCSFVALSMLLYDGFKAGNALEVKWPNIIMGPLINILATMHVQNAIMNDRSMVASSLRPHPIESELVPKFPHWVRIVIIIVWHAWLDKAILALVQCQRALLSLQSVDWFLTRVTVLERFVCWRKLASCIWVI